MFYGCMTNQDETLSGALASVDIATTKNLNNLVSVGEILLDKPVTRVNFDTGMAEEINNGGTNREALKRYNALKFTIPTFYSIILV